ncbi:hypothetical protein FRACYDRAFT_233186 [Fragilariopsis cylindrus CCMP1102]|uniref:Uncharacterized protein n=1 Tax=Fragilariopsis cylindrus CCMP1102 TaxID=635003 RepID=A0A1E7FY00_9STRA|nr:hypothetical protein FRACYDRAFT_233186 [Fragilariopsis cylindrus CCMP1102]|eukprot:OEU23020.1 hypothetical protein FRACYDRAFT_233186 [Fragilariopsis cylindrus CCMP1102]
MSLSTISTDNNDDVNEEAQIVDTDTDTHQIAQRNSNNDTQHSPTIVNNTEYPIVVFCERGVLYNKQVLYPGEALTITRKQTGGGPLRIPYKVHAVIGDEGALPTNKDSIKNALRVSAVPAAFVAGCLITAASAGTLVGPSAALAPLVSGLVVQGVVIDAAAVAAGTICADQAKKIAEVLLIQHKERLMCVTPRLKPGQRYLSVTGGLSEGPVIIKDVPYHEFDKFTINAMKIPIKTTTTTTTTGNSDSIDVSSDKDSLSEEIEMMIEEEEEEEDDDDDDDDEVEVEDTIDDEEDTIHKGRNCKYKRRSSRTISGALKNSLRFASIRKKTKKVSVLETTKEENTKQEIETRDEKYYGSSDPPKTISQSSQLRHNLIQAVLF